MTKAEILQEAARRLGDTSSDFVAQILTPALDFVLLDLAQHEAMSSLRRTRVFTVTDARDYDTREITKLMPHYPLMIERIYVWAWGAVVGRISKVDQQTLDNTRLQDGEDATGPWRMWSSTTNPYLLRVHPPAGVDEAGVEAEVTYVAPPAALAANDDILEIGQEHLETLVFGIHARACAFKGETSQDANNQWQLYLDGRRRMWGQRWNPRIRQVRPFDF